MPNQLLYTFLCTFISGSTLLSAQVAAIDLPDPATEPQPAVMLLSGIAPEGSDDTYRTFFLSAEHPFSAYHYAGLLYSGYLPDNNYAYYGRELQKGSYEIGVFSKFFLHGRLSGRRSHLFFGPQLRLGVRKKIYRESTIFDSFSFHYRTNTTKVLFGLGGQYHVGHAVIAWSLPLGLEFARTSTDRPNERSNVSDTHFCTLPSIALGIRL